MTPPWKVKAGEHIIRTFCWHSWEKWSTPFCGTWVDPEDTKSLGVMSQRRTCTKCGRVSYRKCR